MPSSTPTDGRSVSSLSLSELRSCEVLSFGSGRRSRHWCFGCRSSWRRLDRDSLADGSGAGWRRLVLLRRRAGVPASRVRQLEDDLGARRRDVRSGRGDSCRPGEDVDLAQVRGSVRWHHCRRRCGHRDDHAQLGRDGDLHVHAPSPRPGARGECSPAREEVRAACFGSPLASATVRCGWRTT